MSWQRLRFQVDKYRGEAVSSVLEACLALAVTIENAGDDEFYEVAFPSKPDWEKVYVTGLFGEAVKLDDVCQLVKQVVPGDEPLIGEIFALNDRDWERVWLQYFKPLNVGRDLWVVPKWLDPVDPNACNIALDPGLAFGTGTHRTTAMCLDWLSETKISGRSVIDYGCGSGILAIAALLLGAKSAVAVDVDPMAISASIQNGVSNGISDQLRVLLPEQIDSGEVADIIIVNILAEEIIKLAPTLLKMLKPGFTLLITGILVGQRERVVKAFPECQFKNIKRGQWCLLIGSTND